MKKIVAMMLAVAMMIAPIQTRAEINMTWCPDARDELTLDWYMRVNKKGEIVEQRGHTRHIITYAPEQVTAKAYADHITVSADVTTAAKSVVIQWSTDPSFKKDVKVITRSNAKHRGPVYCFLKYDYKNNAGKINYVGDRTFRQGGRVLNYRHLESHDLWDGLVINYQSVSATRQKVSCVQSYKIPVKYGRKYYVRVYLVYPGIHENLYSRRIAVKVR